MPTARPPCPDAGALARYADGRANDREADAVSAHLDACPDCLTRLGARDSADPLVVALRGRGPARAADAAADAVASAVIQRLTPRLSANRPAEKVGGYRVRRVLADEGGSVVAVAERPRPRSPVVLKWLKEGADADARARFERAAAALAAAPHPHVAPVEDAGEERGRPFLVMPVLPGELLEDRLLREGPMPPAAAARVARQAAEGLAALRAAGAAGGAVRAADVWLEPDGAGGETARLLDFLSAADGAPVDDAARLAALFRAAAADAGAPSAAADAVDALLLGRGLTASQAAERLRAAERRFGRGDRRRYWLLSAAAVAAVWVFAPARTPPPGPVSVPAAAPAPAPVDWATHFAGASAAELADAVGRGLREANPGAEPLFRVEDGRVVELTLDARRAADLRPVAALKELRALNCAGVGPSQPGRLTDLAPLRGLPLRRASLGHNPELADLSPLAGMPLTALHIQGTAAVDLRPLAGMPLASLSVPAGVSDLSPLAGLPLRELWATGCVARDLSPLAGAKLAFLGLRGAPARDFATLAGGSVEALECDFEPGRDAAPLRLLRGLAAINDRPAAEFLRP